MRTAELDIRGLGSRAVDRGVCSALNCIHGVAQVRKLPDACHVSVTYDAYRVRPRQFKTAVRVMGCEIERLRVRPERAGETDSAAYAEAAMTPANRPESAYA
jgi:hypothetical protein